MMLIKSVILNVLVVTVSSNHVKLLGSSAFKNHSILHSDMTQLFELCYSGASNPIILTANLVDTFYGNLMSTLKSPIIVIDESFIARNIITYYPAHPLYILSTNSIGQLKDLLMLLKSSPFWSIKSTFYVIGDNNKSCRDSPEILRLLWEFELLSSFVVCSKTNEQTMLYTYNPYTNRAPDSWRRVRETENRLQRWTLFKKAFTNDPGICETLRFDKTRHMDGYSAKIVTDRYVQGLLREFVFPSLDMTEDVHYHDEIHNDYKMSSFIMNGERDIATGLYSDDQNSNLVNRIPVSLEYSRVIVTQKRSFTFSFREIVFVLDYKTALTIIGVLFLIFVIILMNTRYHISAAFFDVFQLLLRMGMDSPLDHLSMKFIFFTASFFMFYFGPLIDSQLFALLTRPQSYTIESLKDLHDHQYHIYYYKKDHNSIIAEELWTTVEDMKYLHPVPKHSPDDCLKLASKNNTVACIFQSDSTLKKAMKKNLHVSKNFIFKQNIFFWSRKNWALNDRVYERLLNVVEAGFRDNVVRINVRNVLKKRKAKDRLDKIADYDEITEENLYYFYIVFVIWQLFAVFVFIIEHIIARFRR